MDTHELLPKLQDASPGGPLDRLAQVALDAWLNTPMGALVPTADAVSVARRALEGWLEAPQALQLLTTWVEELANRFRADRRALGDLTPAELRHTVVEVLQRPFSPDKKLVLTIIDRAPTRELVRDILLSAIMDFGRKASAPVAGMARGLGSLARFASDQVKSRGGGLGSLVGAVSDEVERQLEKRAVEFVDSALGDIFEQIADAVADPSRAAEAAELRVELLSGALELTLAQLSRELVNADLPGGAEVLRDALQRWLATPGSEATLQHLATFALERNAKRTLREVLSDAGLLTLATTLGREQLRARMAALTATPGFAEWLSAL